MGEKDTKSNEVEEALKSPYYTFHREHGYRGPQGLLMPADTKIQNFGYVIKKAVGKMRVFLCKR